MSAPLRRYAASLVSMAEHGAVPVMANRDLALAMAYRSGAPLQALEWLRSVPLSDPRSFFQLLQVVEQEPSFWPRHAPSLAFITELRGEFFCEGVEYPSAPVLVRFEWDPDTFELGRMAITDLRSGHPVVAGDEIDLAGLQRIEAQALTRIAASRPATQLRRAA